MATAAASAGAGAGAEEGAATTTARISVTLSPATKKEEKRKFQCAEGETSEEVAHARVAHRRTLPPRVRRAAHTPAGGRAMATHL